MIRPYNPGDKDRLIALMKLNTPQYFDPSELKDFDNYLDDLIKHYFVIGENGNIIGCGGFNYFDNGATARISWDMIHPDEHGKGWGRMLTLFRISEIKKDRDVKLIMVRTTQLVYPFYEKLGFEVEKIEKDFWANGYDLYQMKMKIA